MIIPWFAFGAIVFLLLSSAISGFLTGRRIYFYCSVACVPALAAMYWFEPPSSDHSNSFYAATIVTVLILSIFIIYSVIQAISDNRKPKSTHPGFIHLKSKAILNLNDIAWLQSDGHYVEIHCLSKTKPEIERQSLKEILKLLANGDFRQIQRSVVVNKNHVIKSNGQSIELANGKLMKISKNYSI